MPCEKWKPIKSHPQYVISSKGRVKALEIKLPFLSKAGRKCWRVKKEMLIAQNAHHGGYKLVHLYKKNKRTVRTVHSLVAEAFIGLRPKGFDVCHKNNQRSHNYASNLKYGTRSENLKEMVKHGTCPMLKAKINLAQLKLIRAMNGKKSASDTAERFGLSRRQVSRIWKGQAWAHVK